MQDQNPHKNKIRIHSIKLKTWVRIPFKVQDGSESFSKLNVIFRSLQRIQSPINIHNNTIYPRSVFHFYMATHKIKMDKTYWIYSTNRKHLLPKSLNLSSIICVCLMSSLRTLRYSLPPMQDSSYSSLKFTSVANTIPTSQVRYTRRERIRKKMRKREQSKKRVIEKCRQFALIY